MPRRFIRILLAFIALLSSNVWALGLGEIRLESALNEPLRARIELLSAVPGELDNLQITMASAETFQRYGLDRPTFLQGLQFKVVRSDNVDGNYVEVRSNSAITEPFLTFLVEASWPRGRLLREYTVLLDPPTFVPPATAQAQPAVTAPRRSTPVDSGRIERQPSATPPPVQAEPEPVADDSYAFDDETYVADDSSADEDEFYVADDSSADDDEFYVADDSSADEDEFYVADDSSADDDEFYVADDSSAVDDDFYVAGDSSADDETYGSDETPDYYDTTLGSDHLVVRGETLWGITQRVKSDSRLTMNQAMLAIFEANPEAFGGNINVLRAGANLRIPSADEIFQIDRGYALAEAKRHHAAWSGARMTAAVPTVPPVVEPILEPTPEPILDPILEPSLTLVPPDEEPAGLDLGIDSPADGEPMTREQEILDRIAELEAADVPRQPSLIEIRDNDLATLRHELANIRGEIYEPPVDDVVADDAADDVVDDATADPFADDATLDAGADIMTDTEDAEPVTDQDDEVADTTPPPTTVIRSAPETGPTIVERIIDALTSIWAMIGGAVIVAGGILFWFLRRDHDDGDDEVTGQWSALDADELGGDALSATEQMQVPVHDDGTFVVVEQEAPGQPQEPAFRPMEDTVEAPTPEIEDSGGDTDQFDALEDTFSSETAINLDQSDPVAEADFHMAYGLYDQAADLINGALEIEPDRRDLLTKLAEIYFVWGNRDAFVDAAGRLKAAVGDAESAEWDKIVIMGQQIAAEHELFAGAGVAAVTREVDLSFEGGMEEASALDMDFGTVNEPGGNVFDVGEDEDPGGLDFIIEETGKSEVLDAPTAEVTAQMPTLESTLESPTIEQPFDALFDATSELPSIDDVDDDDVTAQMPGQSGGQATGEIDLEDLNLDLSALEETEVAPFDDLDATGANEELADTGVNVTLDSTAATGKNPELDPDSTGVRHVLARDETGQNPMMAETAGDIDSLTDIGLDESLLDATGQTQVLSDDMAVETMSDLEKALVGEDDTVLAPADNDMDASIADDQATMLAPADDDTGDFDFAKTEALPADAFTATTNAGETGEMPAVATTDLDLDLDDLTAALKVSEMGDTVDMPRDDATVEHPRPEISADDDIPTMAIDPEELSDDLHEARTMTEVGTKLDLARAYVDMGDPTGAKGILKEVLDEGDESQQQQAQQLLDSLPG